MSTKAIRGEAMYYIVFPSTEETDEALDNAERTVYNALPEDFDEDNIQAEADGEEITVTASLPVTGSIDYMKATRWDPEEWDDPRWSIPYSEEEIYKHLAEHGVHAKVFMEEPEDLEFVY